MTTPTRPVDLPIVVSVRVPKKDFQHLKSMADANRRTLSQTVRLLIEAALCQNRSYAPE
jgi:hypothetical protein